MGLDVPMLEELDELDVRVVLVGGRVMTETMEVVLVVLELVVVEV